LLHIILCGAAITVARTVDAQGRASSSVQGWDKRLRSTASRAVERQSIRDRLAGPEGFLQRVRAAV